MSDSPSEYPVSPEAAKPSPAVTQDAQAERESHAGSGAAEQAPANAWEAPQQSVRPDPVRTPHAGVFGYVAAVIGIAVALWIVAGRTLVGIDGDLVRWFAYSLGPVYAILNIFVARNIILTAKRGYNLRPSAVATLIISWVCGIGFGFLVPDITEHGLVSMVSLSGGEIAQEIGIGVANPLATVSVTLTIFALVLSGLSARGPKPPVDEDDY